MKDDAIQLVAQADLLLLMSALFSRPQNNTLSMFKGADANIHALLKKAGIENKTIHAQFDEMYEKITKTTLSAWSTEYNFLFLGNVKCPINETGYVRRDKGALLSDIAGFYKAFGFTLSEVAHDSVDHLTCELEFMAILFVMLAQAHEENDNEKVTITRNAQDAFMYDHAGEWLQIFCERLYTTTENALFKTAAQLLQGLWGEFLTIHTIKIPGETYAGISEDYGTPYECDMQKAGCLENLS